MAAATRQLRAAGTRMIRRSAAEATDNLRQANEQTDIQKDMAPSRKGQLSPGLNNVRVNSVCQCVIVMLKVLSIC